VFKWQGIEFRVGNGDRGAQSVFPPSVHAEGGQYTWLVSPDDAPLVPVPTEIVQKVCGSPERSNGETATDGDFAILEGSRHSLLASLAGSMRKRGMSPEALEAALLADNLARCKPSLEEAEVREIARDIGRHPPDELASCLYRFTPLGESQTEEQAPTGPVPEAICLASVIEQGIEWVWHNRIPRGANSLLDGPPGVGKSFILLDVAARLTRGRPMPGEIVSGRSPANVLLLNAEDDLARTIRPRLETLGADLDRVFSLQEIVIDKLKRPPVLPDDLELIEKLIQDRAIELVTIDPFVAFISGEVDSHKDHHIRLVMHGIRQICERTQAAIVTVRHLNKLVSVTDPMYRGGGSIAIVGAARSAFLVGKHPSIPEQRVLARIKGNLCAEPEALAYVIAENADKKPTVEWVGAVELKAEDLLTKSNACDEEAREDRQVKLAGTRLLGALDALDPDQRGVSKKKARERARISGRDLTCAVADLVGEGIIEEIPVQVISGNGAARTFEGIRRKPKA
jgi:hypothetical protein